MRRRLIATISAVFAGMALAPSTASLAQEADTSPPIAHTAYQIPPPSPRFMAFISDLHFGLGRQSNGAWDPTEDFRWPKALGGFLNAISEEGQDNVDLVVVGDLIELWQPPPEIKCNGVSADVGCTFDEMTSLVQRVVAAHSAEMDALRAFAERGHNRIHIIPGNHDSTLRYQSVWQPLGEALNADSGRINLVTDGVWVSTDGRIVAEHGNQIGQDVNKYATWPNISRRVGGTDYVIRPWGELFVQRLFNDQEKTYPIIDNLSPEAAGARYRAADRGLPGSAADIARMLAFNLLETSLRQKSVMLGKPPEGIDDWDTEVGRKLGAMLFLYALPADDTFRLRLERSDDPDSLAVRARLAELANDRQQLPDEEVQQLCDMIAVYSKDHICWDMQLGSLTQYFLSSKQKVMRRHLQSRQATFKSMRVFIYGHTHQFEEPWSVDLGASLTLAAANTGAFQRLIDEKSFVNRLNGRKPEEALRTMSLDELPPCYTTITVAPINLGKVPIPEARAWLMTEDGPGIFVSPTDQRCQ